MAFEFRFKIDRTKVGTGPHTNFPVLITDAVTNIPARFWTSSVDSSGLDIRFYDQNKTVEYKREIVVIDKINRKFEAWVQIPSLASTADTYITCVSGTTSKVNDTVVWSDINAKGVWHLQNNANDSSGNNNTGTVTKAAPIYGKINRAYNFDGNSDYITVPASSLFDLGTADFTVETWFYAATNTDKPIISRWQQSNLAWDLRLGWGSGDSDKIYFFFQSDSGTGIRISNTVSLSAWHHIIVTRRSGTLYGYLDGAEYNAGVQSGNGSNASAALRFGSLPPGYTGYFDGAIDEVRVQTQSTTAGYALTEYNNQSNPASFVYAQDYPEFQIRIDHTKVSTGPHTNFPVLITENVPGLPSQLWSYSTDANGLDIQFFNTDKSVEYKREIVSIDRVNRKFEAWVQIPSLSSSVDTFLTCTVGRGTTANSTSMWSTDMSARGIYHLQANANDSSGNGKNGTVTGAVNSSTKIQNGYTFDGSADYVSVAGDISFALPFYMSVWVYPNAIAVDNLGLIAKCPSLTGGNCEMEWLVGTIGQSRPRLQWWGAAYESAGSNTAAVAGQWQLLAAMYDGVTIRLYRNGIYDGGSTPSTPPPALSTTTYFGRLSRDSRYDLSGKLDEVRILGTTRTDAWILTEYNNQNDPASFASVVYAPTNTFDFYIKIDKAMVQSVNNSTDFVDAAGKIWSASGASKLSTSTYKFAPASGLFDGATNTYITTPDNADFAMGTGDYTIDFWFKTSQTTQGHFFYQGDNIGTPGTLAHNIYIYQNKIEWTPDYPSYPSHHTLNSLNNVNDNAWHHVACVRSGDTFTLYVDGVYQASAVSVGYMALDSAYAGVIGEMNTGTLGPYNGYMDEFRISKGVARWIAGFIPPTSKYSVDSYTKVLLHFGEELINFPVLITESTPGIPSQLWSNSYDVDGRDIHFFDVNKAVEYKREIVFIDRVNRKFEMWVQVPMLSSTVDTYLTCSVGGGLYANSTTMWSSDLNARAVYHMQANANDSSGNGKDGTVVGAVNSTAKIQNGYIFDGSGDYITVSNNISFAGPFTLSAWVYPNAITVDSLGIVNKISSYSANQEEICWLAGSSLNKPLIQWYAATVFNVEGNTNPTAGQWNQLAAVFDGTTIKLYLNGALDKTAAAVGAPPPLQIATAIGSARPYTTIYDLTGRLDEVRILGSARTGDWIGTEYNNQNNLGSYISALVVSTPFEFQLKVDYTKVGTGPHTNFPILISDAIKSLPAGLWSSSVDVGGLDIRFYNQNKTIEYKREIVLLDRTNRLFEAWVQIPSLTSTADTYITCVSGATTKVNDTTVWSDLSAKGIWHLQNSYTDSIGVVNGTNYGTTVAAGKIESGIALNGSSYIDMGANIDFLSTDSFVLSAWIKTSVAGYAEIIRRGVSAGAFYILDVTDTSVIRFIIKDNGGTSSQALGTTNVADGNWHHVAGVRNVSTDKLYVYVDGVENSGGGSTDTTTGNFNSFSNNLNIGRNPFPTEYFTGSLDEVRIIKTALLSGWLATEYANQNDPASFISTAISNPFEFKIKIDYTKVGTGPHTNFPVLITSASNNLPDNLLLYSRDTNGLDIRFYDRSKTIEYKREIVTIDRVNKLFEAWVQIPSLSSSVDTYITCLSGTLTRANDTGVWSDISAKAVYHLNNNANDSSINACNGTFVGSPTDTPSKFGRGLLFNGSTDYITVGTNSVLNLTTVGTLSGWIKSTTGGHHNVIFGKGNYNTDRNGYTFDLSTSLVLELADDSGYQQINDNLNLLDGQWHHALAQWDSSDVKIYVDGNLRVNTPQTKIPVSNVYDLILGKAPEYSHTFNGSLDELRIYSSFVDSNWITTEFNNQNDPATFYSVQDPFEFKIKINKSKVSGTNTNFPVLITNASNNLPAQLWSNSVGTNGLDIRFYNNDKSVEYNREIVYIDKTNRKFESWVQAPLVSSSQDTYITCRVGEADKANDTAVWSSLSASAVYHLQNNANDSSGNSNTGTVTGAAAIDGKINRAYNFNGSSDKIQLINTIDFSGNISAEAWIKLDTLPAAGAPYDADSCSIVSRANWCSATARGWESFCLGVTAAGKLRMTVAYTISCGSGFNIDAYETDASPISAGNWYQVLVTSENNSSSNRIVRFYLNGALQASTQALGQNPTFYQDSSMETQIGSDLISGGTTRHNLDGIIDEVKIYNTTILGADWFATEYNNQNDPATFYSVMLPVSPRKFQLAIDYTKVKSVNNSTNFIDASGKLWSANGAAKLSTAEYRFAPASGYFNGSASTCITTPDQADFATGTGDYTIDFWLKTADRTNKMLFYQGDNSATQTTVAHLISINPGTYPTELVWSPNYKELSPNFLLSTIPFNDNSWHHIACVRYGDLFSLYIDGALQGSLTLAGYAAIDSGYPVSIGNIHSTGSSPLNGYIDEFRFSKGIARWITEFTPPTTRHTYDAFTKVLLHFGDELANFPVLINEACTSLPSTLWSRVRDPNGLDIRFYSPDGAIEYKREVVKFDAYNKKLEIWVQVPTIYSTVDTKFVCVYGWTVRANDTTVWDDLSAKGVYHLDTLSDSSSQGTNLTSVNATLTTGKIENGYNFNGSSAYAYRTDTDNKHDLTGSFTLSAWIKPTTLTDTTFLGKRLNGSGSHNYLFCDSANGTLRVYNAGVSPNLTTTGTISAGVWSHVVAVFNGKSRAVYINGVVAGTQSTTGSPTADNGPFALGADYPSSWNDFYNGAIDEARVLATAISAEWVQTEYNNQNNPNTFLKCSAELTVVPVVVVSTMS